MAVKKDVVQQQPPPMQQGQGVAPHHGGGFSGGGRGFSGGRFGGRGGHPSGRFSHGRGGGKMPSFGMMGGRGGGGGRFGNGGGAQYPMGGGGRMGHGGFSHNNGGGHNGGHFGGNSNASSANSVLVANPESKSKRVFIGNLSWDVNWRALKEHVLSVIPNALVVRADVLQTPDLRSKGCGIVEFATEVAAKEAVTTLHDSLLNGRPIFVREDREDSTPNGGGPGAHGGAIPMQQQQQQQQQHGGGGGGGMRGGAMMNPPPFAPTFESQSRRVYVGNLSWDVAWQDLKDHMRRAGEVTFAEVLLEADGQRSKGCGIVEYADRAARDASIRDLNDTELKGRTIFVREDREQASALSGGAGNTFGARNGFGNGYGGGGGGGANEMKSVYVGNLNFDTSWQDLKDHMRSAGNIDKADILTGEDGRSKGCGIVQYQDAGGARRAIQQLQNSILNGRPIFVREDREAGTGGMSSQLFVGNLSYDVTWKELKDHFRTCGEVERAVVVAGPDNRSKGFGTVKFARAKDAQNAIKMLNNTEIMGRNIEVRLDTKV